jgi:adenosylcobinamide-phosphate synthase
MLAFWAASEIALIPVVWALALVLDRLLGELPRWHPLVGFGRCAQRLEQGLNRGDWRFIKGLTALLLLLTPALALAFLLRVLPAGLCFALEVLLLYLAIGWRSMEEHILAAQQAFDRGGLNEARLAAAKLVSRDLAEADEAALATAMVETGLENSNDALFASLFWFALAGAPGVVLHRLVNTLDAMWGYRNPRFERFGKSAARLDDILAFVPAQMLALSFSLVQGGRRSLQCWWQQGWRWKSINAGSVMAAGAAAIGLRLGGPATYLGCSSERLALGMGPAPEFADCTRVFRLVRRALWLWWLVVLVTVTFFTWF